MHRTMAAVLTLTQVLFEIPANVLMKVRRARSSLVVLALTRNVEIHTSCMARW